MGSSRRAVIAGAVFLATTGLAGADVGFPAAGISQYWVGQSNNSQRIDNPTGVEYYGVFIYYTDEGRLNLDADANDGGGCEGVVVPVHGSAFCQACGVAEPAFGIYPFELVVVRAGDGAFDLTGQSNLGVIANSSKYRAVPMPAEFFSMPNEANDREQLEACMCRELVEDDRPPELLKALGVSCPDRGESSK